ncbi:MAG: DUF4350 domain-containing protein [Candidatus Thorarchaeota archaeon]
MGWKEVLQVILFLLSWVPVGMLAGYTLIGAEPVYTQDFSIYNEQWNGYSQFRIAIEDTSREVRSIQASMSVLTRENGSAVLCITGPVRDFSLDATLVIFSHLLAGGGVLIADDFGTANTSFAVLNSLMGASLANSPLANLTKGLVSFTGGVLVDLDSYDPIKEPRLPIIRDFTNPYGFRVDGGAITQGVNELHLNWATALNPYSLLGQAGIAWCTPRSWCETELDYEIVPDPVNETWIGSLPVVGAVDFSTPQNPNGGRIVAVSDPSIFTNDMYGQFSGNRQFASNVIEWLSRSDTSQPIIFCEELLAIPLSASEFFFGEYLGRVLWLSSLPYISALYPLLTAIGIKKYLPELKKPEVKSVSDVFLRRGQTYFGERMSYYRTEGNFARVVKMLYRKMKRGLRQQQQWTTYDPKKLFELMKYKDPKLKQAEFFITIDRIEEISADPNMKIKESEMMELFFFMRNIQSLLIDTR